MAVQTPQQRKGNLKYAKREETKKGKNLVKKSAEFKSPLTMGWFLFLGFLLCGGALFEILRVFKIL
ncbi:hypothetical protein NADFUDRAFT_51402 [Nadsonia fulvescens var. elongata DSM 6958]|uniref:Stress-associated endoplasmic reticulum protein n=1 Tax=Nadsonia fulvescens var. elongata DSM 6958 TaxID=857566 RepID=A0A1E3PL40_9ASCO|nr:hypothetical protein NADFUDRAFT_51402 [Nadsonia fulvescens var. elongata DSM 6958]